MCIVPFLFGVALLFETHKLLNASLNKLNAFLTNCIILLRQRLYYTNFPYRI